MPEPPPARAPLRVVLLSGPSGAGKSRLAVTLYEEHGWPVLQLDDFYREGGDPMLPMSPLGLPDWDDAGSWDRSTALTTLLALCRRQEVDVPRYDIATSRVVGTRRVRPRDARIVVAEGIFAAHLVEPLAQRDLLAGAWCIRDRPWLTFAKRLARDVRQRRKPLLTLWRRGHRLRRAEAGIVQAQHLMGATAMRSSTARRHAVELASARTPGSRSNE